MSAMPLKQENFNKQNNHRPFGLRDKFGYLFGDLGNDFFFLLVASYLMVFYTDVFHIDPAVVGVLFTVARIWDAFADVTWGRFIDTRPASKHGKFKPWILRMSLPLIITGVLMFVKIPGMSNGFYLAYAFATYILWGTLYSTVNIPYGSMASVITDNPIERTALSTWRTLGQSLAGLIINSLGPIILFTNNQVSESRFLITAVIFGILAFACYLGCYTLTTERVAIAEKEKNKGDFLKTVKGLTKNKPLIWILATSIVILIVQLMIGSVNVYLFKDYYSNTAALSLFGFLQTAVVFLGMPFVNKLVSKFGKKEVGSAGLLLAAVSYLALFAIQTPSVVAFVALSSLGMFGFGIYNMVVYAFVGDVIDYHEYLTGLREDGTVYSIYSFARKIGQALSGGISGIAISYVGYVSGAKVQSTEALEGIFDLATLVPGALFLHGFIILSTVYPLNKEKTIKLVEELKARRGL